MTKKRRNGRGRHALNYDLQSVQRINQLVENGFIRGACHLTGQVLGLEPLDSADLPPGTVYHDVPHLNATLPSFAAALLSMITPVHYDDINSYGFMERHAKYEALERGEILLAMTGRPEQDAMIMAARRAVARVGGLNVNSVGSRLTAFLPDGAAVEFRTPDLGGLVLHLSEQGYHRQPGDDVRGPLAYKLRGIAAERPLTEAESRLQNHLKLDEGIGSYSEGYTQLLRLPPRPEE